MEQERNTSDKALVLAALKDRQAFAPIVARYSQPLRRYITRLGLLDSEAVKDVLQEAFIKAYIHLNDYDVSLSLSAWLYRIARNETMTDFRKQKNRPHAIEHIDFELSEKIVADLDIPRELDRSIDTQAVQTALDRIDVKYREVIVLRFFEEKSYDEISDILQIPNGTVGVYITRGKAELKALLAGYTHLS